MGNYELALKSFGWMPPDVTKNRAYGRTKPGFGINADQQINDQVGVFARLGWNDGQNETWCFTEADEALSAGIQISGNNWHRKNDVLAIATVVNGLSDNHKNYLMRGGSGFQLGDGSLNYGYETAAEIYYSYKPDKLRNIWLTADYQFILNPGYNKDRGPVNAFSVRMHIEL